MSFLEEVDAAIAAKFECLSVMETMSFDTEGRTIREFYHLIKGDLPLSKFSMGMAQIVAPRLIRIASFNTKKHRNS